MWARPWRRAITYLTCLRYLSHQRPNRRKRTNSWLKIPVEDLVIEVLETGFSLSSILGLLYRCQTNHVFINSMEWMNSVSWVLRATIRFLTFQMCLATAWTRDTPNVLIKTAMSRKICSLLWPRVKCRAPFIDHSLVGRTDTTSITSSTTVLTILWTNSITDSQPLRWMQTKRRNRIWVWSSQVKTVRYTWYLRRRIATLILQ